MDARGQYTSSQVNATTCTSHHRRAIDHRCHSRLRSATAMTARKMIDLKDDKSDALCIQVGQARQFHRTGWDDGVVQCDCSKLMQIQKLTNGLRSAHPAPFDSVSHLHRLKRLQSDNQPSFSVIYLLRVIELRECNIHVNICGIRIPLQDFIRAYASFLKMSGSCYWSRTAQSCYHH